MEERVIFAPIRKCWLKYNQSVEFPRLQLTCTRHTFAKRWILNGGDIFRLQKLLGHSNLDIVKEYVNMFGRDLTKDYTSFNPLDTLGTVRTAGKIGFGK